MSYKDGRWEKWSIISSSVKGAEQDLIQWKTRGARTYLHVVNAEYIELTLSIEISKTEGHTLACPLNKMQSKDGKTTINKNLPFVAIGSRSFPESEKCCTSIVLALPPRHECKLLQVLNPDNQVFNYKTSMFWGDKSKSPDLSYRWPLPIQLDKPVLCSQGFNGTISHVEMFCFSVDLAVREGTDVVCPRDGIVIDYCSHHKETSDDKSFECKTNYITLYHEDGTVSEYVHLQYEGVFVQIGDYVTKGQVIGQTGNTGWSYGPHLHFHVRLGPNKKAETLRIRFDNGTKEGMELLKGQFYYPKDDAPL